MYRILVAAGLAVSLVPRTAAADDPPFTIGSVPAWLVLGGVTSGGTVGVADRGAFVGGELSLARLRDASFAGVYADGYYDWGAGGTYATGGVEFGRNLVGLDGGAAVRFAGGDTDAGVAARITVGVYARYLYFPGAAHDDHVVQVGLTLKLPLGTSGGH